MPKPFKPTRPFRLPAGAEIITRDGKPHVRLKERGKPVLYPLTKDGTKYLRPSKRWYFDLRDEDGTVRRVNRLPRTTVQALADRAARGAGPATVNHYVKAVRGFFRWLVRTKRVGSNPLDTLALLNASVDVRHARRELTAAELHRVFDAARTSPRAFRGLAGPDRYMLYLVAAATGFRANALANLTPPDFELTGNTPVVTLAARLNKSRKVKVQPLPADVAAALVEYLGGKPAGSPIWGGGWASESRGADMLRIDLETAGIPYAVEGPDGPEYADFHALRHSFLTLGGRAGIDLRTLQELAGHSDPGLTARYSHRRLYDLAGAVDKLPNLVPTAGSNGGGGTLPVRLTGTDGAKSAVPDAVTGCAGRHQSASSGNLRVVGVVEGVAPETLEMEGAGADLRRPAPICFSAPSRARTEDPLIKSYGSRVA
jgi:integrase